MLKDLIILDGTETKLKKLVLQLPSKGYDILFFDKKEIGGVYVTLNGVRTEISGRTFLFDAGIDSRHISYIEVYEQYRALASDMSLYTCQTYKIESTAAEFLYRSLFFYALKILCSNSYKNVVFLTPIKDFIVLAFATISQKIGNAKFYQRTGIGDKSYFSDNFRRNAINYPEINWENDEYRFLEKCIWNDYSKKKNKESLQKLQAELKKKPIGDNLQKHILFYQKISSNLDSLSNNNSNKKFVYYPLHCDPGRTTQPEAGNYQDQLISLNVLSNAISDEFTILVKEHPRQFDDAVYYEKFRGKSFYLNAAKIRKVKFVSLYEEANFLLSQCVAVATANGTTGWDALTLGKPVILFGNPWYGNVEGCLDIADLIREPYRFIRLLKNPQRIKDSARSLESFVRNNFHSLNIYDRVRSYDTNTAKEMDKLRGILNSRGINCV